jgi:hypothetical protein
MATELQLGTKAELFFSKMAGLARCFYKDEYFFFIKLRLKM